MMLGLDVKLVTPKLPESYVEKITTAFPKAFEPIEESWYGYAPRVIIATISVKEHEVADGWVSIPMTMKVWNEQHSRFYEALANEKPNTERYDTIGMPGMTMWASFDVLSHFGDIMFAAHELLKDGHEVTLEYKEC